MNQHWQIDVESTWISRWPTSRRYFDIYQRWINVECLLGVKIWMLSLTDFSNSTIKSVETTSFDFVGKDRLPKLLFWQLSVFVITHILQWSIYKQISLNTDGHQYDCKRRWCVLFLPWWPLKNCEWANSNISLFIPVGTMKSFCPLW